MRNVLFGIFLWMLYDHSKAVKDPCEGLEDGTRLPHPIQCDRFVICKGQRMLTVGRCPRGLHFNPRLGVCDLKQRARCELVLVLPSLELRSDASLCSSDCCGCCGCCSCPLSPPACPDESLPSFPPASCPTPGIPGTPSLPSTGPSGTTCNNKGVCENQPDGAMLPDPRSSGYIVCQCECEIPMPCPSNLLFNPVLKVCDWPENNSGTSSTSTITSISETSSTSVTTLPTETSTPSDSSTLVHSSTPIVTSTPDTSSTEIDSSTLDTSSTLRVTSPTETSSTPSNTDMSSTTIKSSTSDVSSTHQYTSTVSTTSPTDPATGPSGTTCNNKGICESQPDGAMFSDSSSNGYIVCQCECEIPMPCPSKLVFNPKLKVCDWPSSSDATPIKFLTVPSSNVCDNMGKCAGQRDGTLFADSKTGGYVVCQAECEVPRPCPTGLVFNPKINVCDWPKSKIV